MLSWKLLQEVQGKGFKTSLSPLGERNGNHQHKVGKMFYLQRPHSSQRIAHARVQASWMPCTL